MIKIYNNKNLIKSSKLNYQELHIDDFLDISSFIKKKLEEYSLSNIYEYLRKIPILKYDSYIIDDENVPVYAFLTFDGEIGEKLEDKIFLDENKNVLSYSFVIRTKPPFVVLGNFKDEDKNFFESSIIHELFHLIYLISVDDKLIDIILNKLPNLKTIDKEESFSILGEGFYLKSLNKSDDFIKGYICKRYIPHGTDSYSKNVIKDINIILNNIN